ncbi:MAG: B12-binding domain-containing radical SAM protein [Acidobacteria bacterium]|nr:B12-binding domain-containing radical SAM protein [Acidobacteriota bacterium]
MPRMVFIEPKSPNLHIFSQFVLPRLGTFILGTLMRQRGWDVEVVVEQARPIDFRRLSDADLVGISTITSTAPRAYAIADRFRQLGIPVIMGGPHVTFLADEALEHADYVIRGEGERALMAFIDVWEQGADFSGVPNLSYRQGGETIHLPLMPYVENLDELPFPDFSLAPGSIPRLARRRFIPVQTSRGCPYNCSFCSVTGMFGRRYRFRSTENILSELRRYDHHSNFIFFYDDHFTANPRRAKELLRAMIAERFKFRWSTQVRVDIARDPELVQLMKKAGCHTLFIGLESVNPESLKAMKKQQTVDEIDYAIRLLRRNRIHIHGMFVYGFDQDDRETVRETIRFARKVPLTSTQFMILTPLPGSEFYRKIAEENRILFHDWSLFDAHHAVFKPKSFTLADLQWAQIRSHAKFYSIPQSIKKVFQGRWLDCSVAVYARRLNRFWKRQNRLFLKVLDLLRPQRTAEITVNYREPVRLDDTMLPPAS